MPSSFSFKRRCVQAGVHVERGLPPPSINSHFSRLPLEMLAEILSYTSSPDILALARTSRSFCAILVADPASLFIWKAARRRFFPSPIPDPAPNWTESAYIAFLFDTAECEVCHRPTRRTPFSYALRARLCNSGRCYQAWLLGLRCITADLSAPQVDLAHMAAVQSWLPYFEMTFENGSSGVRLYRPGEWDAALQQHRDSVWNPITYFQIQQVYARKALLKQVIMRHAQTLSIWGETVEHWRINVRRHNKSFLERKAIEENWLLQDFVNTPFYTGFRKTKDALAERITDRDFTLLREEVAEQVAQRRRIRIRRIVEETSRVNRKDLRSHWNMLKTAATSPLPPYSEFRFLDMAKTLVNKNTDEFTVFQSSKESVREELKKNVATRQHITQQVRSWMQDTKTKLSETLGYDHLALAKEAGFIQPVDRVTAWFRCTQCSTAGGKLRDKALSIADVCSHRCPGRTKKDKSKGAWDVRWFEPDQKTIAAVKELLRVCSLEERRVTTTQLEAMNCRLLCKACKSPIVVDFSSLIRHCKRHETMPLRLLTLKQACDISYPPLQVGLTARVTGFSKRGGKQRRQRMFGCRHCLTACLFTFDGMRSHLKSKHDIIDAGDEDLYQVDDLGDEEL